MAKKSKNKPTNIDPNKLKIGMRVLLKDIFKIAIIEKVSPKYSDEFVASYYDDKNKLHYVVINEEDVLPAEDYERLKERNNKINSIFRD
jgi:hypothetical protein